MTHINLKDSQYQTIIDILRKNLSTDDKIIAFGSRVKQKSKPFSDLDLAIETNSSLQPLIDNFEESDLPFNIDILDYKRIPDSFREEIDSTGIIIKL